MPHAGAALALYPATTAPGHVPRPYPGAPLLAYQVIVNGLLLGGLYACLAIGFSLIWGVMNLINLAHGSMMIMGAYVTWLIVNATGIDPFLTLPVAGAVVFVFAYAIQRILINQIIDGSVFMTLILTFGLNLVLINLHIVLFTADLRSVPVAYSGAGLQFGEVRVPYVRVAVFALAVALTVGLHVFLRATRIGQAIRAVAQHRRAAAVVGVDIKEIYAVTFAIGGFMAGAAGSLMAIVFSFSPVVGDGFTLKSFIVVILGGLGSVPGALLGGVVLGMIESVSMVVLAAGWKDAITFSLLVLILVLRPEGLLGRSTNGHR
jgi:branched-chain amino acid transport system permease protein